MTQFWVGNRTHYLLLTFLLSASTASCCWSFQRAEAKLYWYLPFLSLRLVRQQVEPPTTDHTDYSRRFTILYYCICILATFVSGMLCYVQVGIGWFNYDKYTILFSTPWSVPFSHPLKLKPINFFCFFNL